MFWWMRFFFIVVFSIVVILRWKMFNVKRQQINSKSEPSELASENSICSEKSHHIRDTHIQSCRLLNCRSFAKNSPQSHLYLPWCILGSTLWLCNRETYLLKYLRCDDGELRTKCLTLCTKKVLLHMLKNKLLVCISVYVKSLLI